LTLPAAVRSCFWFSSLAPPVSLVACGELAVELAEDMDAAAEVAGVGGSVQGIPGQDFDLKELAFVFFRAVHGDDHGAAVVADALGVDVCTVKGGFDDGGLFGVGESWQGNVLSPALPALRGVIEKGFDGGVGLALHVAVDIPEIDHSRKGHPIACDGDMLHRDCVLSAQLAHERDLHDLRALGGELNYC